MERRALCPAYLPRRPASNIAEVTMANTPDADASKGAFEPEDPREAGNTSLGGQLPHRTNNPLIKNSDSDFPEPGSNPEHSGEREEQPSSAGRSPGDEGSTQTQEPGHRQKRNQGDKKDDPLVA
jgi:hypothetical protein